MTVPFTPGRTDATPEMTDAASFAVLEPTSDGFRNYVSSEQMSASAEKLLVQRAQLLNLNSSEMAALVGGLRVLNANTKQSPVGVLTSKPGVLSNDFFVNLLDMSTEWHTSADNEHLFEARYRKTGDVAWIASRADLVFGSNSELRAISEFYACNDSNQDFVADFAAAFAKVMNLDRFDLDESRKPRSRL